jgi:hypothetical protein
VRSKVVTVMPEHLAPENRHPVEPRGGYQGAPGQDSAHENTDKPELTVVIPDEPPLLTPLAAEALLRLVQHVAAQRGDAQVVPMPARNVSNDEKYGRKAA